MTDYQDGVKSASPPGASGTPAATAKPASATPAAEGGLKPKSNFFAGTQSPFAAAATAAQSPAAQSPAAQSPATPSPAAPSPVAPAGKLFGKTPSNDVPPGGGFARFAGFGALGLTSDQNGAPTASASPLFGNGQPAAPSSFVPSTSGGLFPSLFSPSAQQTGSGLTEDERKREEAQVLAGLARLGFHGLKAEDLGKLVQVDEYEKELEVMAEVRAYFKVAYKVRRVCIHCYKNLCIDPDVISCCATAAHRRRPVGDRLRVLAGIRGRPAGPPSQAAWTGYG